MGKTVFIPLTFLISCSCSMAADFTLTSSSFKNGGVIPAKFASKMVRRGENVSPELSWENAPEGVKSFVISCIDVHRMAHGWVHWMVINIPSGTTSLSEGVSPDKMPAGSKELKNSFRYKGWGGPQPPPGTGVHDYVITVFALKVESVPVKSDLITEEELRKMLKDDILAEAKITGKFSQ